MPPRRPLPPVRLDGGTCRDPREGREPTISADPGPPAVGPSLGSMLRLRLKGLVPVASAETVAYNGSRNSVEKTGDYRTHPLATTNVVSIDMEYDKETESFVTYVK